VCIAISLDGYRSLLGNFFADESKSLQLLLQALDIGDVGALHATAHAFKGACASLGFHGMAALAFQLEQSGAGFDTQACMDAAQQLRSLFQTAHALCLRMGLTSQAEPAH